MKQNEVTQLKSEFEQKIKSLIVENDKNKDEIKLHSDWIIEKTYLEKQIAFQKNQIEENKRIHETLFLAI